MGRDLPAEQREEGRTHSKAWRCGRRAGAWGRGVQDDSNTGSLGVEMRPETEGQACSSIKEFGLSAGDSRGLWNDFKKSCSMPKSVLQKDRVAHLEAHGREG